MLGLSISHSGNLLQLLNAWKRLISQHFPKVSSQYTYWKDASMTEKFASKQIFANIFEVQVSLCGMRSVENDAICLMKDTYRKIMRFDDSSPLSWLLSCGGVLCNTAGRKSNTSASRKRSSSRLFLRPVGRRTSQNRCVTGSRPQKKIGSSNFDVTPSF